MASIALLGSGEFLPWVADVDRWCAERARATGERVLVVPTASALEGDAVFARWGAMGLEHYRSFGLSPEILELRTRADAMRPAIVDAVAGARIIFFSGGNPGYLAQTLLDTPFWEAVCGAVASDETALGGCSAGASFLGALAPYISNDALDHWTPGVCALREAFFIPHFDALDSYGHGLRALFMRACPPGARVVGIDENTALYGDGTTWQVAGAGAAWVADAPGSDELEPARAGAAVQAALGLSLA